MNTGFFSRPVFMALAAAVLPGADTYGPWPRSGEIDIMEHVGFDHGRIHTTPHRRL
jgi:hypothetical protein